MVKILFVDRQLFIRKLSCQRFSIRCITPWGGLEHRSNRNVSKIHASFLWTVVYKENHHFTNTHCRFVCFSSPPQLQFPAGAFDCWAYMTCNEAIQAIMARLDAESLMSATPSLLLVRAELWRYALEKVSLHACCNSTVALVWWAPDRWVFFTTSVYSGIPLFWTDNLGTATMQKRELVQALHPSCAHLITIFPAISYMLYMQVYYMYVVECPLLMSCIRIQTLLILGCCSIYTLLFCDFVYIFSTFSCML